MIAMGLEVFTLLVQDYILRIIDALGDAHPLLLDIISGHVILSVLTCQVIIDLLLSLVPFLIESSPVLFLLPSQPLLMISLDLCLALLLILHVQNEVLLLPCLADLPCDLLLVGLQLLKTRLHAHHLQAFLVLLKLRLHHGHVGTGRRRDAQEGQEVGGIQIT